MQHTQYHVLKEVQKGHWVELTPLPRSRGSALKVAELAAGAPDFKQVRVIRETTARLTVKTFNKV